jgi:peptidoglycan biosynthesis protein MviN/MurJ (putative lipid II flippase)
MNRKIGRSEFPATFFARLWLAAVIAAAVAWAIKLGLHPQRPLIAAVLILVPYGAVYLGCTEVFGVEQARGIVKRLLRRKN